jgi:hypothetical protein
MPADWCICGRNGRLNRDCGRPDVRLGAPTHRRHCVGARGGDFECGAAIVEVAPASREERKVVTVLFADLVGFTSRSEQLDPEDAPKGCVRDFRDRSRMRSRPGLHRGTRRALYCVSAVCRPTRPSTRPMGPPPNTATEALTRVVASYGRHLIVSSGCSDQGRRS